MLARLLLAAFVVCACGSTRAQRRVDGSYLIDCKSQKSCLDRAARQCGDSGYDIIGGRHDQKIYGVPGNQKVVGKDQLYIRCRNDAMVDVPDQAAGSWKLERNDKGSVDKALSVPRVSSVCRSGETQRCVGAAACEGAQTCKADGSGFESCDCGVAPAALHLQSSLADGGVP
jgi:hypothetical protein